MGLAFEHRAGSLDRPPRGEARCPRLGRWRGRCYWLVDPQARTLERLVLRDDREHDPRDSTYTIAESLAEEETFRPASFDGVEIPLARLWG
ncbi:MAG TPA: hypothetical protein VIY73_16535 [Polyangiaceae bacterium]